MEWRNMIVEDPDVLGGRPVVAGTRLAVDFILDLLAQGWTEEQLLENYPGLSRKALEAVFAFSAESLRETGFHSVAHA